MTTKLYWQDPHLTSFTAVVVETFMQNDHPVVVLDQTAFYPTGGGQPNDTGIINETRVVDVSIDDDERVLHHLASPLILAPGERVECQIDRARRRDLTQQHTGQHILSQAFFRLFGAETRGFRIGDQTAEIDLTLEAQPDEVAQAIARAEDLANEVVFDDRVIRTSLLTPEQAQNMPLRKESFVTDCVRVVEIDEFDFSPCGGTHAARTGEVGLIAARSWERAKRMTRVQFVCGERALRDYRAARGTADAVARHFTVAREDALESVLRLAEENKLLTKRNRVLAGMAAQAEASELISRTAGRIVCRIFDDRGLEEVKLLAHALVATGGIIALLATREREVGRLIFARAADVSLDVSKLLREVCEGRGGGKPDFAQAGCSSVALDAIMEESHKKAQEREGRRSR
jgi:alanyl-tRNA synthetase